jgi:hypothetical protein
VSVAGRRARRATPPGTACARHVLLADVLADERAGALAALAGALEAALARRVTAAALARTPRRPAGGRAVLIPE